MSKFNSNNLNENKENEIYANYQENNLSELKEEETFLKEKDLTFLDQSQLDNLIEDPEKIDRL